MKIRSALTSSTLVLLAFFTLNSQFSTALAQNTVFTYQGRVMDNGTNFTGAGQFEFALVTSTNTSSPATATATLSGSSPDEFVTSYAVISGGSGYTAAPAVTISGGGGSGATATATINVSGEVTGITPGSAGTGYSSTPTVTIAPPPSDISYTTYWSNDGTSSDGSEPNNAVTVDVTNGLFTVILGDTTLLNMAGISAALFSQPDLQLRIWFNDGVIGFAALNPPQNLTPTPYAVFANMASNVSGTVSAAQLGGAIANGNLPANPDFSGTITAGAGFDGNGANVTDVNAVALTGLSAAAFWQLGGNNVTAGQFLGSTNSQPVVLRVGNVQALWLGPVTDDSPNVIGGAAVNTVDAGVTGSVIAGGGTTNFDGVASSNHISSAFSSIGGGSGNWVQSGADHSMIGNGWNNTIVSGSYESAIAGGENNTNSGSWSSIGGGSGNAISGSFDTVAGGVGNTAGATFDEYYYQYDGYATVGGGFGNAASGAFSVVAGGGGYFGGDGNTANNFYSAILGGYDNMAGGEYAAIGGGYINTAIGEYAVVSGGEYNTNNGYAGFIGGGAGNQIPNDVYQPTIGGGWANQATNAYATVGGGQQNFAGGADTVIGGGNANTNTGNYATVGGGNANTASGYGSFIGGGGTYEAGESAGNRASGAASVIGGGFGNTNSSGVGVIAGGQQNLASGLDQSTVGGGYNNQVTGSYATIPGGANNVAGGRLSFAAGDQAQAMNQGAFVWSDGSATTTTSFANNQFIARASGGVVFLTSTAASPTSYATGSAGVALLPNATAWTTVSDQNAKKNFEPVDTVAVLEKLATIPIQQWNYKWEKDTDVPNIGPMAQDFKRAFYPGRDDKGISTLEFDGVELAAIQGLNRKLEETQQAVKAKDGEIQTLKHQNDSLAERLNELEATVKQLVAQK